MFSQLSQAEIVDTFFGMDEGLDHSYAIMIPSTVGSRKMTAAEFRANAKIYTEKMEAIFGAVSVYKGYGVWQGIKENHLLIEANVAELTPEQAVSFRVLLNIVQINLQQSCIGYKVDGKFKLFWSYDGK